MAETTWNEIRAVQSWFPSGRMVVGLLGSSTFHDPFSPSICRYLGEALWEAGMAIVTPNSEGIAEMVTWSYIYSGGNDAKKNAFHLATTDEEKEKKPGDVVSRSSMGWLVAGGTTKEETQGLFAMITPVYILIEGGPRAAMMARIAVQQGAIVIPVSRTGGASSGLFGAPIFRRPSFVSTHEWLALTDTCQDIQTTTTSIVRIVQALYHTIV